MTVRDTSAMGRQRADAIGLTANYRGQILRLLRERQEPLTRAEIAEYTDIRINCVCAPVLALVLEKTCEELEPRRCRVTGFLAHPVRLVDGDSDQGELF